MQSDDDGEDFEEEEDFNTERDDYAYLYEGEILQDDIGHVYEEQHHTDDKDFDECIYFNKEENSGKEECELRYEEDDNDDDDNEEDVVEEEEWYKIFDRKFALDPVLP